MASIDSFLQGKPIWPQWKGPISDLLTFAGWSLPTAKRIGLGAWNDKVLFHSVRLKVISGEAEIPSTVAAASADSQDPFSPFWRRQQLGRRNPESSRRREKRRGGLVQHRLSPKRPDARLEKAVGDYYRHLGQPPRFVV